MKHRRHILFAEFATGLGGSTRCLASLLRMCRQRDWMASVAMAYPVDGLMDLPIDGCLLRVDEWAAWQRGRRLRSQRSAIGGFAGRACATARSVWAEVAADRLIVKRLARFARDTGVDLIHANNEVLVNRPAILAGVRAGVPVVSHQRGWCWPSTATRRLARRAQRIIAISDFIASDLVAGGVPGSQIERVYDGIDAESFQVSAAQAGQARRSLGFGPGDVVIGLPAVLLPWKGHKLFLDALARIAAERPRVKALLVGASPRGAADWTGEIQALIRAKGLEDRVRMTGHVGDMAAMYAAMDVVVHASLQPEPFGLVVAEAMAAGRPVVAANAGGPAEIVRHSHDGLLYQMGDVGSLAGALGAVLDDAALRSRLTAHAQTRAREFDERSNWEQITSIYDDLLRTSGTSSVKPVGVQTLSRPLQAVATLDQSQLGR